VIQNKAARKLADLNNGKGPELIISEHANADLVNRLDIDYFKNLGRRGQMAVVSEARVENRQKLQEILNAEVKRRGLEGQVKVEAVDSSDAPRRVEEAARNNENVILVTVMRTGVNPEGKGFLNIYDMNIGREGNLIQ